MRFPELVEAGGVRYCRWDPDRHTRGLAVACADAEVMRYIGGRALTPAEVAKVSERIAAHWDRYGFGLWAVVGSDGQAAGFTGACHPLWFPEYARDVEVGWRLARPVWGRGYASTGARRAIEAAFEALGAERLLAFVHPRNDRSAAVAERLGMSVTDRATDPNLGHPLAVYELSRAGWRARRAAEATTRHDRRAGGQGPVGATGRDGNGRPAAADVRSG